MLADAGKTDEEISAVLHTSVPTICRARKRFVKESFETALEEKPRSGAPHKLDGKQEAYLVALACSSPPTGRERWTLHLLRDRIVELGVVEEISTEAVRLRLKKTARSLG
jgi:transposase